MVLVTRKDEMDSKELAAVRNWTRGVTPQELLDHIDTIEEYVKKLEEDNATLQACHEAELGVCQEKCDVVAELRAENEELKLSVQRWTDEAANYCKNADYWEQEAKQLRTVILSATYVLDARHLRHAVVVE
jgi:hypothetical protein